MTDPWRLARSKRTFIAYCLFGIAGVALDFLVYSALVRTGWAGYQQANAAGYLTGTVLSFVLNSRYNFPVRDRIIARFFLFLGVALTGYLFSAFALHLLVERAGVDRYVAKAATLVAVVLIQYNLNRLISLRGADS